jgi:TPR repeat protein
MLMALYQIPFQVKKQADKVDEWLHYMKLSTNEKDAHKDSDINLQIGAYLYEQKSYKEALKYFKQAVDFNNNAESAAYISMMFDQGVGVKKNLVEAFRWQLKLDDCQFTSLFINLNDQIYNYLLGEPDNNANALKNNEVSMRLLSTMSPSQRTEAMLLMDGVMENSNELQCN